MSERRRDLRWVRIDGPAGEASPFVEEPFPPRESGDVSDLMSSIRIHGLIVPLVLRPRGGKLQVICGHRRLLAARAAGLEEVPALIVPLEDAEAIRFFLSENLLRRTLEPRMEEDALHLLKAERLGSRVPSARVSSTEAPRAASRPLTASCGPGTAEAARGRDLLGRMQALLDGARSARCIDPALAEEVVDGLLGLLGFLEAGTPFDLRDLSSGAVEDESLAIHSLLTAGLSVQLAGILGLSAEASRRLLVGALLHDAGMVFLREPGLGEPRSLSDEERARIESHTRIGCALIAGSGAWDPEVAHAARDHHERWNGTGYPLGRRRLEIGPTARILARIDTYAALVMPRPHRDAISPSHAAGRVLKAFELGLFDPSLAPAFAQALRDGLPHCLTGTSAAADSRLRRNSVELKGGVITMLSKEST